MQGHPRDGVDSDLGFLAGAHAGELGFLVVGYNPLLCVRQNVGDGLSGSDELSFFKSTLANISRLLFDPWIWHTFLNNLV
jgi:hypothetical protein